MESNSDTENSKIKIIQNIFNTMEYTDDLENIKQASEWLKSKPAIFAYIDNKNENPNGEIFPVKNSTNDDHLCNVHVPESTTIDTILTKVANSKNTWLETSATKRAQIIYKFGTEIQKKQALLTQLEVLTRGILGKHTKAKELPLLTDYLQYYSSFTVTSQKNDSLTKGIIVAVISDNNALSTFGCILGPCLASGNPIIIQTGPKLSVIATLLIELAVQSGIPDGTIRLIPGNQGSPAIFFTHPEVSTISIFDDLWKENYLIANSFGKNLIHFNSSSGTSMIVFDDSDLDSACHNAIGAAFDCKGMLPWAVRNIYVQENIFDNFVTKMKHKTTEIKVGKSNMKNVDVTSPDDLDKIGKIVKIAASEGVEIFQPNPDNIPVLFIGNNGFPNNVINEDFINVPIVTIAAFRTINEAVILSNNSRHGLGASVWTESSSLVNEIIGKLKVSNIWINSHGLFSAEISMTPYKTSGNSSFGGRDGFYEYVQSKILKNEAAAQEQNKEVMEKAINEAKKAQDAWAKLSRFERMKKLQLIAQDVENKKSGWNLPETWLNDWVNFIHECNIFQSAEDIFSKYKNFNLISTREPCGIVAIETSSNKDQHNKKLIISALCEGNVVIILNECKEIDVFYSHVSKLLPNGVFTQVVNSQDAVKVAALHKELNVFIGEKNNVFCSLSLKSSSKFRVVDSEDWREVKSKVTLVKNIWLNKGQSFM